MLVQEIMAYLSQIDPEVGASIQKEFSRQQKNIELIASENFVSKAVMAAMGSWLTNKYAEGYPAKRYYGGCQYVDIVENLAIERAKKLFGCDYVNVQPHSGAQANMAVFFAILNASFLVVLSFKYLSLAPISSNLFLAVLSPKSLFPLPP